MNNSKTAVREWEALTTHRVIALVICLALVLAPHALRLPAWVTSLAVLTMAVRAGLAWRGYGLPKAWLLGLLGAAAAASIWLSYGLLLDREAAVALLILMVCLKLLELRTARDAVIIVFLGYFAVITNFLYSQTLAMGAYLLGCVWLNTAYLVGMQREAGPRGVAALLRQSGWLLVQAAPVMVVLFLFFPRIQGPLWALPHRSGSGVTGLSDTMSPGSVSNLSLSDAVAFRVEFETTPPPPSSLYWRGPVMWDFDGRTWRVGERDGTSTRGLRSSSRMLRYTVTLEPHEMRWMFGIDLPAQAPELGLITPDFELLSSRPVRTRLRYTMQSYLDYQTGLEASPASLRRALALPDGVNPRARALGTSWQATGQSPAERVRRALNLFREQPFFYTLAPPEVGADSVDEFLFTTRRGFCEHFASSFVVLMRAAGVPARIVTGYQGGVLNPVGGYVIVRQYDAHAWAEVWLAGSGWVRVDPTAAVSPQRIASGMAAAVPAGDPLPLMARADVGWVRTIRFGVDTLTNQWNQWVLGYTHDRQAAVLSRITGQQTSWRGAAVLLIAGTGIVVTLLSLVALRRNRPAPRDLLVVAWDELSAKLARKGLSRKPCEGPLDYCERIAPLLPPRQAEALRNIGSLYTRLRYLGSASDAGNPADLRRAVRSFRLD